MKCLLLLLLPALAFAQLPPTQEEAQAKFDSAVSSADAAIAEAIWYDRASEKESLLLVWSTSSEEEIRALSRHFRLVIPPPKKEVVDGQEVLVYESFRCGCHGQFVITLKKKGEELLSFVVAHGEHIGAKALREDSAIRVEKVPLASYYAQLVEAAKKKANQMPEPTGAGAPVAHR